MPLQIESRKPDVIQFPSLAGAFNQETGSENIRMEIAWRTPYAAKSRHAFGCIFGLLSRPFAKKR